MDHPHSLPGVVKDIEKAVEETSTMDAPTEEEKALWKGLRGGASSRFMCTLRNRPFSSLICLFKMVVFYSYVSLPEGMCLVLFIG